MNGYPDDLWELCEQRRPGVRQPTAAEASLVKPVQAEQERPAVAEPDVILNHLVEMPAPPVAKPLPSDSANSPPSAAGSGEGRPIDPDPPDSAMTPGQYDAVTTPSANIEASDEQTTTGAGVQTEEAGENNRAAKDVELPPPVTLDETFVDSLRGPKQRKLLKALNGKGRVRISAVLSGVYGTEDSKNEGALLRTTSRLNGWLTEQNAGCEVRKEGGTLILSLL
jgi:hypothetical protein